MYICLPHPTDLLSEAGPWLPHLTTLLLWKFKWFPMVWSLHPAESTERRSLAPCLPTHIPPGPSCVHADPTMALCRALSSWTADVGQSNCGRNALPQHGFACRMVDNHPGLSCTEHPFTSWDGKCHAIGKRTHPSSHSLFQISPCCLWPPVTACTAVDGQTS